MKIAYASDLHLEFGNIELKNEQQADVLVLAGDICVARDKPNSYVGFFKSVSEQFPKVVYIMGNHEHYNGDIALTKQVLENNLKDYSNIYILEKESLEISGYTFVCGTMWSDMNGYDEITLKMVGQLMNDFRCISNSNRSTFRKVPVYQKTDDGSLAKDEYGSPIKIGMKMKEEVSKFSTHDAYEDHKKFIDYLHILLQSNKQLVVVTHHAPSGLSTPDEFKGQFHMNGGYRSHLDHLIEDHPSIKLWIHGHMHDESDYKIGNTRVVANPRGYIGYETIAKNFQLKYLEL